MQLSVPSNNNYDKAAVQKQVLPPKLYLNQQRLEHMHDDYQQRKKPSRNPESLVYRSQNIAQDNYQQQFDEMARKVKIRDLNYEQIAQAYYKAQKNIDSLHSNLKVLEEEKIQLQDKQDQHQKQLKHKDQTIKELGELISQYQQENAQQKIQYTKLLQELKLKNDQNTMLEKALQQDNQNSTAPTARNLYEQLRQKTINENHIDHEYLEKQFCRSTISSINQNMPNPRKESLALSDLSIQSSNEIIKLQLVELKKYQNLLQEKNQIICNLSDQIKFLHLTQEKLSNRSKLEKTEQEQQPKKQQQTDELMDNASPRTEPKEYTVGYHSSQDKLQTIYENIGSPMEYQLHRTTNSQLSMKSQLSQRSRKEKKDIFQKINQSTLLTASMMSSVLDYYSLQQKINPAQLLSPSLSKDYL